MNSILQRTKLLPIFVMACVCRVGADEEPPLPTWDFPLRADQPQEAGRNFSNLLPEGSELESSSEFYLGMPGALKSPPLLLEDSEFSSNDLNLFLHGGLLNVPSAPSQATTTPTSHLALREIPEGMLAALKSGPRNEYFVDPQSLVTEVPAEDVRRLLEFHASEARIILYVVAMDHHQQVTDIRPFQEWMGRLRQDAQHEVCLALYPVGEPWRTRFLVTQAVSDHASLNGLTEMAEDCIEDALRVQDPDAQLQRFVVRLSTRLFWLEKGLPVLVSNSVDQEKTEVQEVGRALPLPAPAADLGDFKSTLQSLNLPSQNVMGLGGVGLLAVMGLWMARKRARRKLPRKVVWMLPEVEVTPRLGGAFSGGAGAAVQYRRSRN